MNRNPSSTGDCNFRRQAKHNWKDVYDMDDLSLLNLFASYAKQDKNRSEPGLEILRRLQMLDPLLNHEHDDSGECSKCSKIVCPFGEPLHFHHDGCPACCSARGEIGLSPDFTAPVVAGENQK